MTRHLTCTMHHRSFMALSQPALAFGDLEAWPSRSQQLPLFGSPDARPRVTPTEDAIELRHGNTPSCTSWPFSCVNSVKSLVHVSCTTQLYSWMCKLQNAQKPCTEVQRSVHALECPLKGPSVSGLSGVQRSARRWNPSATCTDLNHAAKTNHQRRACTRRTGGRHPAGESQNRGCHSGVRRCQDDAQRRGPCVNAAAARGGTGMLGGSSFEH